MMTVCDTHTRSWQLGSSVSLEASQMTCFYKRQPPTWHKRGIRETWRVRKTRERRKKEWQTNRGRQKTETIKRKESRGKQTEQGGDDGRIDIQHWTNHEGQKTSRCEEKKHSAQTTAGAELTGWGLIWRAAQHCMAFSRHCSLPRSSGHTLISHACQQHE